MNSMFSLEGKNAIVTGAAKETGLCFGMARALHEAGATIVIIDVSDRLEKTIEMAGGAAAGFYGVKADLSDYEDTHRGFEEAMKILGGRLDILLNGAGMQHRCPAVDFPIEQWEKIMHVNLSSAFQLSQLAGRVMIAQGHGKIINVASMNAFLGGNIIPAYSCSKAGIAQLTKALSNEWAPLGVNVNALAPGYMETEWTVDLRAMEQAKEISERIPAKRWGKPEDLQGTVVFLASSASDYVSGTVIPVDGGYLAH